MMLARTALGCLLALTAIESTLPARAATGATLQVSPQESVQAGLNRASPGDTVMVRGLHREQVVLRSGITLVGDASTTLTYGRGPVLVLKRVRDVTVKDLHVSMTDVSKPEGVPSLGAIDVEDSDAVIAHCSVASSADGIAARGSGEVSVLGNDIGKAGGSAIHVAGSVHGRVEANRVIGAQVHGICLVGEAAPTVAGNDVALCQQSGIACFGHAHPDIIDNLCRRNGVFGVLIDHQAAPALRHNTVVQSGSTGVQDNSTSAIELEANVIATNGVNLALGNGAHVRLDYNLIPNLMPELANDPRINREAVTREVNFTGADEKYLIAGPNGGADASLGWSGPRTAGGTLPQAPVQPPVLQVRGSFQAATGDGTLDAGETGFVSLAVRNGGKGPATRLLATVTLDTAVPGLVVPQAVQLGSLAPGEERTVRIPIQANGMLPSGKASVTIRLEDAFGYDAPLARAAFATRAAAQANLALAGYQAKAADGSGVLARGREIDVDVSVTNRGKGAAHDVAARLLSGDGRIKVAGDERCSLGAIGPGESKVARFSLVVTNRYDGATTLPIAVVLDERGRAETPAQPLRIVLDEASPTVDLAAERPSPDSATLATAPDEVSNVPFHGPANPHTYAVVVGIERYGAGLPAASFARRDAADVRNFLETGLGVPPENIIYLTDERATGGNIRTAIEGQLAAWVERDKSDVIVYFAGHGVPDMRATSSYLVPFDGNPAYPATSCYPLAALYEGLAKLGARSTMVMLDACFSGQAGRGDGSHPLLANLRPIYLETTDTAVPAGMTVFAAAAGSQVSGGFVAKQHGLFTYYLLQGLLGAADSNHDRHITVDELRTYLATNVVREARRQNREQTPQVLGGDPGRVLVTLP